MNYIIIDLQTETTLSGFDAKTLKFSSYEAAEEFAQQMFADYSKCLIVPITIRQTDHSRQKLFEMMEQNHNVLLLESDMDNIERLIRKDICADIETLINPSSYNMPNQLITEYMLLRIALRNYTDGNDVDSSIKMAVEQYDVFKHNVSLQWVTKTPIGFIATAFTKAGV